MRLVDRLYDWLSQGPTPDCDRIFGAALPLAEPAWERRIVDVLLYRATDAAWAALIGQYDRLPADVRERLLAAPERVQGGISIAYKSDSAEVRLNALRTLADQPCPRMAYLLSQAIRDPSPRIRELAGGVFRTVADAFLTLVDDDPHEVTRHCADVAAARRQLVLGLEEALRTFDLHHRNEVIETALWFSRDLGDRLWERLNARRGRLGVAVSEQLGQWNHPRLAHFLVTALRHPTWRRVAAARLARWSTREELHAMLRETDQLDDSCIRKNLAYVQNPRWFDRVDPSLRVLDPDLRSRMPRWTCHAGIDDQRKTALLTRWIASEDPALHRAAVYALAEVDTPAARKLLRQVAKSDSPLATFARWCVVALDTEVVRAAIEGRGTARVGACAPPVLSPSEQSTSDDCTMLWQTCRRTPADERGPLIAALRAHAEVWRPQLRAFLHSPDPRDRILALQVISTEQLALRFRHDLEPLLDDPVDGIRRLAKTLVQVLSQQPAHQAEDPAVAAVPPPTGEDPQRDRSRRRLRRMLEKLSSGEADATDARTIHVVRELLSEVYGPGRPEDSGTTAEEQS